MTERRGKQKNVFTQKTSSDQTHAMIGKSAQPEKMINRARTKNPTQLDPATNWQVGRAVQCMQCREAGGARTY